MGHTDPPPPAGPQYPPAPGAAPYPYPQQPQGGGVTAPGGYPVYSPTGAGPSSGYPQQPSGYPPQPSGYPPQPSGYPPQPSGYPPQPSAFDAEKPGKQTAAPPPAGYPDAGAGAYPGSAYPPPPAAGPAPGYPVMGTAAPMSVDQPGTVAPGQERCGCSPGWVLFGVGWIFWPCWVAAAFLPLCTKNRNDRLAGLASSIAMLVLVVIGIIIGATSPRWRSTYYY